MKCPHCTKNISIFSKSLNKLGRVKICPFCEKKIKFYVSWIKISIWFIPLIAIYSLIIQPLCIAVGLGNGFAVGSICLIAFYLLLNLKASNELNE